MMRITRNTYNEINRTQIECIMIQKQKKNGEWGKAHQTQIFGGEIPEHVIKRLEELNPGQHYRLAK